MNIRNQVLREHRKKHDTIFRLHIILLFLISLNFFLAVGIGSLFWIPFFYCYVIALYSLDKIKRADTKFVLWRKY